MNKNIPATTELMELANLYPSPHNGQPIKIRFNDSSRFDVFFDKARGLQSSEISFIFSFVSMGVFIEHFKSCGQALGHAITFNSDFPSQRALKGEGLIKIGSGFISWNKVSPDKELLKAIKKRQTSRKKYSRGIDPSTASHIAEIASTRGMAIRHLNNQQARQAIWLNQRAVFDDMFDEATRQELDHWLRYSKQQKNQSKDGLAYDCMELNGHLMKFIVKHPGILKKPGISKLLQTYYTRTMTDSSDVFYMLAPFATEADAFAVGEVIMKVWMFISQKAYYLHPFGTIMSNQAAHSDFLKLANISHENRNQSYLVFIFRAGRSASPVRSLRLPVKQHLLMEEQ